jgi:hypothetical protein
MTSFLRGTLLRGRGGLGFATAAKAASSNKLGYEAGDVVPSLAGLIPKLAANQKQAVNEMPWVKSSHNFFQTWKKVAHCMPKYAAFLDAHKNLSIVDHATGKTAGFQYDVEAARKALGTKTMNEEAMVALGEFYLCVGLQLRPEEMNAAGSDKVALMEVARRSAEEDFEPFIDAARELVADYDRDLHKALEETSPFYEVDLGLFWHANFDVAAPAEFLHFVTALGHGSGFRGVDSYAHVSKEARAKMLQKVFDDLQGDDAVMEPARRAAAITYSKWLEAASMPVKATISQALMEHGLLVGLEVHDGEKLLPELEAIVSRAVEAQL